MPEPAVTPEEVARAVQVLQDRLGYCPSVREVATTLFLSTAATHKALGRAREQGLVAWTPGKKRTLRALQ